MTTDNSQSDQLDELLLQWEEEFEQGRDVPAHELCRDCSDLIPLLQQRVEALKRLNWLNIDDGSGDQLNGHVDENLPETLGRFLIETRLGSGGFAQVWRAFDPELHRTVAIKVPHRERLLSDGAAAAFQEEARRLASLKHRSIAQVHDVGREGNLCFLVCEFIEGGDLRQKLKKERPTSEQAVEIICEVADALQFAHDHGFVHRDIKPENILLGVDGRPVLADFGIAVLADGFESTNDATSGTLRYMSPEQFDGKPATSRSDVFSLGIVFYELLTGQHPFDSEIGNGQQVRPAFGEPASPRTLNGKIAPAVEQACLKCLAVRPADRFESAASLAETLRLGEQFAGRLPVRLIASVFGTILLVGVGYFIWNSEVWHGEVTDISAEQHISTPPPREAPNGSLELHREAARQIIERGGYVIIRDHALPLREAKLIENIDGPIVTVILRDQPVDDSVLPVVAGIPTLLDLNLTGTDITDDGLVQLRGLTELTNLALNGTSISDVGLANLPDLPSLLHLQLRSTRVSDTGLSNIRRFPELQTLILTDTQTTDDGVRHLMNSPALRTLQLNDTEVTDKSVSALSTLKGLEVLGVRNTGVSAGGLSQLRDSLPRADIIPMENDDPPTNRSG